jgi:hypothetical protein
MGPLPVPLQAVQGGSGTTGTAGQGGLNAPQVVVTGTGLNTTTSQIGVGVSSSSVTRLRMTAGANEHVGSFRRRVAAELRVPPQRVRLILAGRYQICQT